MPPFALPYTNRYYRNGTGPLAHGWHSTMKDRGNVHALVTAWRNAPDHLQVAIADYLSRSKRERQGLDTIIARYREVTLPEIRRQEEYWRNTVDTSARSVHKPHASTSSQPAPNSAKSRPHPDQSFNEYLNAEALPADGGGSESGGEDFSGDVKLHEGVGQGDWDKMLHEERAKWSKNGTDEAKVPRLSIEPAEAMVQNSGLGENDTTEVGFDSFTAENGESLRSAEERTQKLATGKIKSSTGKINPEVSGPVRHPEAPPPLQVPVPATSGHAPGRLSPPPQDTDPTPPSTQPSVKVTWKLGKEYAAQLHPSADQNQPGSQRATDGQAASPPAAATPGAQTQAPPSSDPAAPPSPQLAGGASGGPLGEKDGDRVSSSASENGPGPQPAKDSKRSSSQRAAKSELGTEAHSSNEEESDLDEYSDGSYEGYDTYDARVAAGYQSVLEYQTRLLRLDRIYRRANSTSPTFDVDQLSPREEELALALSLPRRAVEASPQRGDDEPTSREDHVVEKGHGSTPEARVTASEGALEKGVEADDDDIEIIELSTSATGATPPSALPAGHAPAPQSVLVLDVDEDDDDDDDNDKIEIIEPSQRAPSPSAKEVPSLKREPSVAPARASARASKLKALERIKEDAEKHASASAKTVAPSPAPPPSTSPLTPRPPPAPARPASPHTSAARPASESKETESPVTADAPKSSNKARAGVFAPTPKADPKGRVRPRRGEGKE